MKTLQFSKEINASANKVWDILWGKDTYTKWTKHFSPDSNSMMQTDWQVGGRTLFLDGSGNGMVSTIKSLKEPYELVFEHRGMIMNGHEDTTSEQVTSWAGAEEAYYLSEQNGTTTLNVTVQANEEWQEMLANGFVKGLEVVKDLSEQ